MTMNQYCYLSTLSTLLGNERVRVECIAQLVNQHGLWDTKLKAIQWMDIVPRSKTTVMIEHTEIKLNTTCITTELACSAVLFLILIYL